MNIEVHFNKSYLTFIETVVSTLEGDANTESETLILDAFEQAYAEWYETFSANQTTLKAASCFYLAVGDYHDQLINCDEQLFAVAHQFFQDAFHAPDVLAVDLYNLYDAGTNEETDAKSNFWEALNNLYRLSTVLCIYQKMPIVKQILDHLISQNPDITKSNVGDRVMKAFNTDRKMRRLFMKLMNETKEEDFIAIFSSLQRVVAALAGKMDVAAYQARAKEQLLQEFLQTTSGTSYTEEQRRTAFEDLLAGECSYDELQQVFENQEFHTKIQQYRKTNNLGSTMHDMLTAYNNKDQAKMNSILQDNFNVELPTTDTAEFTNFSMAIEEHNLDVDLDKQREVYDQLCNDTFSDDSELSKQLRDIYLSQRESQDEQTTECNE